MFRWDRGDFVLFLLDFDSIMMNDPERMVIAAVIETPFSFLSSANTNACPCPRAAPLPAPLLTSPSPDSLQLGSFSFGKECFASDVKQLLPPGADSPALQLQVSFFSATSSSASRRC